MLTNESQHEKMLLIGLKYLDKILPKANIKILHFSDSICSSLIDKFGNDLIAHEFSLPDYEDEAFVFHLAFYLDFGVPIFIIKYDLYNRLINTENLLPVVTALNFSIAEQMATIFNNMNLRHSKTSCVYANDALMQLVNRSMGRFNELSRPEFDKFIDLFN
jgi:hypothetical protein